MKGPMTPSDLGRELSPCDLEMALGDEDEISDASDSPNMDEVEAARNLQDPEEEAAPSGFIVALTNSGLRRLHYVGACGKTPGRHYLNFVLHGDEVPPAAEYDKSCVSCFGKRGPELFQQKRPDSSSGSSGSSSSSED